MKMNNSYKYREIRVDAFFKSFLNSDHLKHQKNSL